MYKLKKNGRIVEVHHEVQLHAFLSSGWEIVKDEGVQETAPSVPSDEEIVLETDAVMPKRRGRKKQQ